MLTSGENFSLRIKKRNEELDLALYQMISDRNDFQPIIWKDGNASSDVYGCCLLLLNLKRFGSE